MKKLYCVIHVLDLKTTEDNLKIAVDSGAHGVFLINMDYDNKSLTPHVELCLKSTDKSFFIGVNRLDLQLGICKHILEEKVNGIWVDNPGLYSYGEEFPCEEITNSVHGRKVLDPEFKFFGSVAFKTQKLEPQPAIVAVEAKKRNWIVTTSGPGTGIAPETDKIRIMKEAIGEHPLAVASGITPYNVDEFIPYVDYFIVATGISKDFYNFDPSKVKSLADKINGTK